MNFALYHPTLGYYKTRAFNVHDQGDFLTAPEISSLFADCFAQQCLPLFKHLNSYHIVEIGAGSGRFASDLLIALENMGSAPVEYTIYETSPMLRIKQQTHIKKYCPHLFHRISWLNELPTVITAITGIIIVNEVLDALPVHCFRIGHCIEERGVTWKNDQFKWQLYPPSIQEFIQSVSFLQKCYGLQQGYESEVNLQLFPFVSALANALSRGVILIADYGYGQREYYHPERCQGTLTCFYQHRRHHDPFMLPGLQDISSHVDFTRVIDIASGQGCSLSGYTSQSSFLLACGLLTLAKNKAKKLTMSEEIKLHQTIKLLTFPTEMGERVKIMALSKHIDGFPLLGFSGTDRRRDL
jgi:SAM-dependent MidA family methyltransferase